MKREVLLGPCAKRLCFSSTRRQKHFWRERASSIGRNSRAAAKTKVYWTGDIQPRLNSVLDWAALPEVLLTFIGRCASFQHTPRRADDRWKKRKWKQLKGEEMGSGGGRYTQGWCPLLRTGGRDRGYDEFLERFWLFLTFDPVGRDRVPR